MRKNKTGCTANRESRKTRGANAAINGFCEPGHAASALCWRSVAVQLCKALCALCCVLARSVNTRTVASTGQHLSEVSSHSSSVQSCLYSCKQQSLYIEATIIDTASGTKDVAGLMTKVKTPPLAHHVCFQTPRWRQQKHSAQ